MHNFLIGVNKKNSRCIGMDMTGWENCRWHTRRYSGIKIFDLDLNVRCKSEGSKGWEDWEVLRIRVSDILFQRRYIQVQPLGTVLEPTSRRCAIKSAIISIAIDF